MFDLSPLATVLAELDARDNAAAERDSRRWTVWSVAALTDGRDNEMLYLETADQARRHADDLAELNAGRDDRGPFIVTEVGSIAEAERKAAERARVETIGAHIAAIQAARSAAKANTIAETPGDRLGDVHRGQAALVDRIASQARELVRVSDAYLAARELDSDHVDLRRLDVEFERAELKRLAERRPELAARAARELAAASELRASEAVDAAIPCTDCAYGDDGSPESGPSMWHDPAETCARHGRVRFPAEWAEADAERARDEAAELAAYGPAGCPVPDADQA